MKRILIILLALCTVVAFAACTKAPELEPTEPVVNTDEITDAPGTEPPIETEPGTEPETKPETTTEPEALDPTKMNKEQLIQYYNDAINLVRTGKPAYTRTEILKVNDFKTSILGGAVDGLISGVVKKAMPGDPKTNSKNKGENNVDHFMHPQQTSNVRAGDVTSISAKKDGANYVVTLTMGSEANPAKEGQSKYSRVMFIQTRQEVLDDLANNGLTGTVENTTLTYHSGKSEITVNEKGQIIKASCGFFVDVTGKSMKIAIFNPDIDAFQQSSWDYTGFTW